MWGGTVRCIGDRTKRRLCFAETFSRLSLRRNLIKVNIEFSPLVFLTSRYMNYVVPNYVPADFIASNDWRRRDHRASRKRQDPVRIDAGDLLIRYGNCQFIPDVFKNNDSVLKKYFSPIVIRRPRDTIMFAREISSVL